LDEIIDDVDIFAVLVSFLDSDFTLIPFPTDLDTDDFLMKMWEIFLEPLGSTIIREGDDRIIWELEERGCGMEFGIHSEWVEEETFDEGVDVEGMNGGFLFAPGWEVGEEISEVASGGDFSFLGDALHRPDREIWDDDSDLICVVVDDTTDDGVLWEEFRDV
jgi:hypothetical protein